jgi:hypothetical protein
MNPPTEAQVAVLVETVSSVVKSSGGGAPGFGHRPTGRAPSRRATWMITVATALAFVAVGVAVWSAVRPDAVVGPGQKHGELEPAGTFPLSIDPTGADVEGELLYLACGENGLLILDVSDPAAPREVGGYREAAVSAVDVEGGVAFISVDSDAGTVSSDDGAVYLVRVLDVSDPTAPTPITDYRTESFGWDAIQNITVHGDYLALSTWQKIELVDVSDPRRPAYLWSWEGVSNTGITCHTAFIDAEEFESPRGDVLVLAAGWEGLRLFDLSDPTAPTPLGVYTAGDWVADVDTIGTTVHAAVGGAGLVSLNVAEPASPQPLATYDVPGATADLHPFGELLYYSFYDTSDDLSLGNGFGSVRVPGAGEELVAVTGAEVVYPVGPVTTLIGDDAHLYVAVEGLGLFVYEPDRN